MLYIIQNKLRAHECDEIMEVAWSTMWNVTGNVQQQYAYLVEVSQISVVSFNILQ